MTGWRSSDSGKILALDAPLALVQELLKTGFHKDVVAWPADLEDVYLHITGKQLREG